MQRPHPAVPDSQPTQQDIKTVSSRATLPVLRPADLRIDETVQEDKGLILHTGVYDGRAVMMVQQPAEVLMQHQESWTALYQCRSPFWAPVLGTCEVSKANLIVIGVPPKTGWGKFLTSSAADAWPVRCRVARDVAVGLYQCRTSGATHIAWNRQQLYLDAQGRAQILPCLSETAVAEADDVFALGRLLWCMVSRSTTLVNGWEQGKGLSRDCPPEVITLIRACTDSTVSARPSLKTLAKGLDVLWQRVEQGFSDLLPALPQRLSPLQKEQKYETPSLTDPTATITQTQLSQVQSSGSLNLLLVDDQTVSWLSADDPRYQVGLKLCALRNSLAQPVESKASLPTLQQEIQRTLIGSHIEMLLWLGEEGQDPSHSFQETAWQLWQTLHWQAYRPGDPPPSAWLPLFIHLHHASGSPLFTRNHQLTTDEIADFTDSEWQTLQSRYALFWLVQGVGGLADCNLYETNALSRAQGRTRLLLHTQQSVAFRLEKSTYFMPQDAEGRLLPARYARYTTDPDCDFSPWKGHYSGVIGTEVREVTAPMTLTPAQDLALNRDALKLPTPEEEAKNTLGKGSFGEVLRGTYEGQPVAVKRFKKSQLLARDQALLKDEAKVMAELQSPFLIHLLGLSLESPPLLMMELAPGGSLYDLLKDGSQALPWSRRLRLLRDIALGLSVLHAHELLHRDLKSLNILLDMNGRAKLCDFGLSTLKSQARDTSEVGTLLWNAPEVLQGKVATAASDIYSFAMICWEVVTRRLPYSHLKTDELGRDWPKRVLTPLVLKGHREIVPTDCPPELAVVIQACWAQDPARRPTASQVAQVLEGLWQQAVIAEQSRPAFTRQPSTLPQVSPLIRLENKRTEPLMREKTDEKSLLIHASEVKSEVKAMSSGATAPRDSISIFNDPELRNQPDLLGSLKLVMKQSVTSVEVKTGLSSGTTAPGYLTPLSSVSPEMAYSLEQSVTLVERKIEHPPKPMLTLNLSLGSESAAAEFKTLLAQSQQPPPCWQDKQSPSYTLGVKLQHLREKVLTDPYITQELSCYIEPNSQSQAGIGQSCEPLFPWVERELLQGAAQVLLLQGLAGAGKSTFNRSLLRTLWQDPAWQSYRPGDPIPRAPVPVFIPLQSVQVNPRNLWDYYHHLPEISFTSEEIRLLQSDYHTVWIADGYDELPGQAAPNVYDGNHLHQTAGRVKLVIGCRSQRVQALVEADSFVPHTVNGAPDWPGYRTRHVSPFTVRQTQDYIDKYVAQHQNDPERPKDWDAARYQAEFKAIPELKTLIDTPFMLWMTLSILPELAKAPSLTPAKTPLKTEDSMDEKTPRETKETSEPPEVKTAPRTGKTPITRAALYDRFMDTWFTRQAKKAYQQRGYLTDPAAILGESRKQALKQAAAETGGDDVQVHWLKAAYRVFCLAFAEQLLQSGQVGLRYEPLSTPESKTTPNRETLALLLGDALPDGARLRSGGPLRESSDHTWSFMHASLLDYFMTTSLAEQLLLTPEPGRNLLPVLPFWTRHYDRAVKLLTRQRLTPDQVRFLVDRTQRNPALQAMFFQLIERSKTDSTIAIAAGNAVTVLNVSGVNLCGRDWPGVRIPGANLRYGILGNINLSGADLTGADLTRTWLYGANLQGATLAGVEWGEVPRLECKEEVQAIAYHPQEPWLAIAQGNTIEIRRRETGERVGKPLTGHTNVVESVSFSPDGRLVASGSEDKTVRLWSVESQEPQGAPLTGHERAVTSVSFSPDGRLVASGSWDKTVQLWSVESQEPQGAPLTGHESDVRSVSFSPDGRLVASGSED